jgi:lipoyl(octanoyl) transferase
MMNRSAVSSPVEVKNCEVQIFETIPYEEAVTLQEFYVKELIAGKGTEKFLLLQHDPVITLGRGFHEQNLLQSKEWLQQTGISVHESSRGGDVTYHGPGQVVGYPIIDLSDKPDLHLYLRNLEELMIRCVADFGVVATRKKGLTGIWVNDEKIGAIGVRVVRWITSHGFALNVNPDLQHFEFIIPCGIQQHGVTSLNRLLGREIPLAEVHKSLIKNFELIFKRKCLPKS